MVRQILFGLLLCMVLAVHPLPGNRAMAQRSFPVPGQWNGYDKVVEFDGGLVNMTSGSRLTATSLSFPQYFKIPLSTTGAFTFKFMDTTYELGVNSQDELWVSVNGAAKFVSSGTSSPPLFQTTRTYDLSVANSNDASRLIMPFWGNFTTYPNSGGVFARFDGPLTDQRLTIEWNVFEVGQAWDPAKPIRFQLCLYEKTDSIEFRYDRSSPALSTPTSRTFQASYGAVVGLKNIGQPECANSIGNPRDYSLLITPDPLVQSFPLRDHLPLFCVPDACDLCSTSSSYKNWAGLRGTIPGSSPSVWDLSPDFHYSVPPKDYRIKPVWVEIGGDTTGNGSRVCNIYRLGDTVRPVATYRNYGAVAASPVTLRARFLRVINDTTVLSLPGVLGDSIQTIPVGKSVTTIFSEGFVLADTLLTGKYLVKIWASVPGDHNPLNDTIIYPVYLAGKMDAMPCCINSPLLKVKGPPARYPLGKPIPVSVGFFNAGTETAGSIPVKVRILDAKNVLRYADAAALDDVMGGEERVVQCKPFKPKAPGTYYVVASTHLVDDMVPGNDTLYSIPYATRAGTAWITAPAPIPFIVGHPVDLGLKRRPMNGAQAPVCSVTNTSVPVTAMLVNNGVNDQRNITIRARLTANGARKPLAEKTIIVRAIEAGGQHAISFDAFQLPRIGSYTLTITVTHPGDATSRDNSLTTRITRTRVIRGKENSWGKPGIFAPSTDKP